MSHMNVLSADEIDRFQTFSNTYESDVQVCQSIYYPPTNSGFTADTDTDTDTDRDHLSHARSLLRALRWNMLMQTMRFLQSLM